MSKLAFIFPGQGAQETGMGLDLMEASEEAKSMLMKADQLLDFDLMDLLGNEEAPINQTAYTQPALVAVSMALHHELVKRLKVEPAYVAGLSLGEYSAHVAAGSLSFEDAVTLVRKRGLLMEEAGAATKGAMAAIVKGDKGKIAQYCQEDEGTVVVANYNSPVQVVISGEEDAVARVSEKLSAEGTRVIPLTVSGAFHSPLMESAASAFEKILETIEFNEMKVKLVTNVTGEAVEKVDEVKGLLVNQLKGSVMWEKSVESMIEDGVDTFVEIGPGKTLAGLIKKINRKVKVYNVNSWEQIEKVSDALGDAASVNA